MEVKLWNSINNRVDNIVVELQQPNYLEESTMHIRSVVGLILLLDASNSISMRHILPAMEVQLAVS
jgi:hypothetical protein